MIWSVRPYLGIQKKNISERILFTFCWLQNKTIPFGKSPPHLKKKKKTLRDCWAETQTWVMKAKNEVGQSVILQMLNYSAGVQAKSTEYLSKG